MCGVLYERSEELRRPIFMDWLVNPSGLPGHWHELDLLRDHLNFWLKLFNSTNTDFDSPFFKEAISLNILSFCHLRSQLPNIFGLTQWPVSYPSRGGYQHSRASLLGRTCFPFIPGRSQPFSALDAFTAGHAKLANRILPHFLAYTSLYSTL